MALFHLMELAVIDMSYLEVQALGLKTLPESNVSCRLALIYDASSKQQDASIDGAELAAEIMEIKRSCTSKAFLGRFWMRIGYVIKICTSGAATES